MRFKARPARRVARPRRPCGEAAGLGPAPSARTAPSQVQDGPVWGSLRSAEVRRPWCRSLHSPELEPAQRPLREDDTTEPYTRAGRARQGAPAAVHRDRRACAAPPESGRRWHGGLPAEGLVSTVALAAWGGAGGLSFSDETSPLDTFSLLTAGRLFCVLGRNKTQHPQQHNQAVTEGARRSPSRVPTASSPEPRWSSLLAGPRIPAGPQYSPPGPPRRGCPQRCSSLGDAAHRPRGKVAGERSRWAAEGGDKRDRRQEKNKTAASPGIAKPENNGPAAAAPPNRARDGTAAVPSPGGDAKRRFPKR